jgi:hypothetical protein
MVRGADDHWENVPGDPNLSGARPPFRPFLSLRCDVQASLGQNGPLGSRYTRHRACMYLSGHMQASRHQSGPHSRGSSCIGSKESPSMTYSAFGGNSSETPPAVHTEVTDFDCPHQPSIPRGLGLRLVTAEYYYAF